jgi:hypothetical protein
MYGDITYNMELKTPAAYALLAWKGLGLAALIEGARTTPRSKNDGLVIELLAKTAAGNPLDWFGPTDPVVRAAILEAVSDPAVQSHARALLVDSILQIESDNEVASRVGLALMGFGMAQNKASLELITAVSKRWLAISTPVLERYEALLRDKPNDEPAFQSFLVDHPQLLDPLATNVWPQPNLFGF